MEGVLLPAVSIFFSALLCFVFFLKKRIKLFENSIYGVMLVIVLIDSILVTLAQGITSHYGDATSLVIINFLNKADFLTLIVFSNCVFLYTLLITIPGVEKKINEIIVGVGITDFILYFIIIFTHVYLISDGIHYSVKGFPIIITYIVCGFYLVLSVFITIFNYKRITKRHIPILSIIVIGMVLFVLFQINPYLIVISATLTFVNYLMFFTIQNPDVNIIQQLELAREQADKANRAKTDFLSSMSHEIRTPLNAIVGFSECVMDAKDLGEAKENARDIVNASQTLLEIVNGILDISKIEAGKLEIVNSKYDAVETFEDLAKLITPKMKEKGLDFTYNIAPDLPRFLFGDHANLKKIVTNLLSNACKYTDRGYVHYEVNCVNSNNVSKLIISVEDSGRGIKKQNIDKMFTKFQRLEEDRNTTIEGTGLGLAITKQLIELMGGRIIVHTVYGEGSKFTVVLNQRIESQDVEIKKRVKTTLDLAGVRILLVDDTALNLKVATKLLEKYNANHIVTCDSGFECIDRIKRGEIYDLILLDDMMPKMSGVETLKKLKEIPAFKIPTIALTANAITGMREKYLADGFDDYLAKPIEKEQLISVINQILGRSYTEDIEVMEKKTPQIEQVPIRNEEIPVVGDMEKAEEERQSVIPVEDNIEEILGDSLEKSYQDEPNARSSVSNSNIETLNVNPVLPIDDLSKSFNPTVQELEAVNEPVKFDEQYLRNNGVDLDHALELLGDMEMYNMTISDFVKDVEEKWNKIVEYKDKADMPNYAIEVHSLKSDCKYLGFMTLADISYQHELKSKENDLNFVQEHFDELFEQYQKVLEVARTYVEHNHVNE